MAINNLQMVRKSCANAFALLIVAAVCALVSCNNGTSETRTEWKLLDNSRWAYGDTLRFALPKDSVPVNTVILYFCHDDAYPYANLWIEMAYQHADTTVRDTVNLSMADDYGRWHGKGNGLLLQYSDTIATSHSIDTGTTLRISHIMRVDTLPYIEKVGVEFPAPVLKGQY